MITKSAGRSGLDSNTIFDGVAKSPPYGVTAFFQNLDILHVYLRP